MLVNLYRERQEVSMTLKNKDLRDDCDAFEVDLDRSDDGFELDLRVYAHQAVEWLTQPGNPVMPLVVLGVAIGLGIHHLNIACC